MTDAGPLRAALAGFRGSSVRLAARTPLDPGVVEQVRARVSAAAHRAIAVEVEVDPRLDVAARLILGRDRWIDLDPGRKFLADLQAAVAERRRLGLGGVADTAAHLAHLIDAIQPSLGVEDLGEVGKVLEVGDGTARVAGLGGVGAQELIRFRGGVHGIAFDLLEDAVGCLVLGAEAPIEEGSVAERTGRLLHVPVGARLLGRVVDALGQPLDGGPPIEGGPLRPVENLAPGVVQRHPVVEPLHTGVKIIDALAPLGRGQRELILGDRKIGKTTIAIDTILSQQGTGVVCIYTAIGQKAAAVARLVDTLAAHGAMAYTVVVAAFAGDPPAFRHLAPYAACAIGEDVMARGGHALVVYDDLSKHAVTYREISALLERPIGREAYPGDIFYLHSRLLERAARLRDDLGGGSLTAIPIVETLAGDISAFIPTNVISICDGQIFLDGRLFNEGTRPAMDVGLSVSRVGGMAQTPAMKKVAGRLRIDLAQYHEMAQFVRFGAEVDQATLDQLTRGEREREVLEQEPHRPLHLEEQVVALYAAVHGHLDRVPVARARAYEAELLAFLAREAPDVLAAIRDLRDLTAHTEEALVAAIRRFTEAFLARKEG
ncbi:MAG TPA: F0F1 ATP synthase subunit alpha [Kofleriaceae bacterium]|nr:F0F1 ATP synthase subunit alpha [Kofleriaceae bacterium]